MKRNKVLDELIQQRDFSDYSFFSASHYPYVFELMNEILEPALNEQSIEISKSDFEKSLNNQFLLQVAYIDIFTSECSFRYMQKQDRYGYCDLFIMTLNEKVILFFVRTSIASQL
jgi:hypothetical protein